ncbi:hypothetical protein E3T26_05505 [Cryobacterium sp. TMT1-21]|uniref:AbiEi antitoxin C-terminal domain-containing protein n=1 Tax=Cryobacterium shii TaxID=1259235 RepID=A0AAQ2C853_9MICO|nr:MULTISPECIES: hypothetical protein [Cryobacterium]TFC51678.1 hypothetical protein E3O49_03290 [Cryobacterium shii]TFC83672.1 hypothetical protein E3T24_11790 [Cryobacterium sp. TmT2-59]TFD13645.1 hypothetical protein E3T42_13300 [Cryobacterium sp. TMT4-10]TFD15992.1 hypothetical protein E3T26_05505 [Cryobacterium sp. TMT1-21]TFD27083.1 hypothetical protein E3T32_02170 [Cryobacterium sp. TMT2-23]
MSFRLQPVLSARDLPLAELCCARLDGEVFKLGDFWCPVDEPGDAPSRARAAGLLVSPRAIAERLTAAWIYGLTPEPRQHQFCVHTAARMHLAPSPRLRIREVSCSPDQVQTISGLRVTRPLRTVVDLARWNLDPDADGDSLRACALPPLIAALLRFAGHSSADPARRLCAGPNVPYKAQALARLDEAQVLLDTLPAEPTLSVQPTLPV